MRILDREAQRLASRDFGMIGAPLARQQAEVVQFPLGGRMVFTGTRIHRTTYDLAGRFVEYVIAVKGSVLGSLFGGALGPVIAPFVQANQGEGNLIVRVRREQPLPATPPRVILDNPMRGQYLGAVLYRALRDVTTPWDPAPQPPDVIDVNNADRPELPAVQGITAP